MKYCQTTTYPKQVIIFYLQFQQLENNEDIQCSGQLSKDENSLWGRLFRKTFKDTRDKLINWETEADSWINVCLFDWQ